MPTDRRRRPDLLFDANPPEDEGLVVDLFWNRETELEFGLRMLRDGASFPKVLAVHGHTRAGKSHLVRRILEDVRREGLPYLVFSVNANNRGTAVAVLEEAFCLLWHHIRGVTAAPDGEQGVLEDAIRVLGALEPLVLHEATEVEHTLTRETAERLAATVKLVPPGFELSAGGEVHVKDATLRRWRTGRLDARDLVQLIRYECDVVSRLAPGHKVLLFVDDLDLLDRPGTQGAQEKDDLVAHLQSLADQPPVVVVVTVRGAWFNGREKDFKDFLRVGLLGHNDLVAIYRMHVDVLNGGEAVFDDDALEWLERGADGKVGIFLSLCYRLWQRFGASDGLITDDHVRKYVHDHIDELRRDPVHVGIVVEVEQAIRRGQLEVTLGQEVRETEMIFRVLTPLPARPNAYGINPLYADALRERLSAAPETP